MMSHRLECPHCLEDIEVESETLPSNSCDDVEFECPKCLGEMKIGWVAEVEVRSVICELGDVIEPLD